VREFKVEIEDGVAAAAAAGVSVRICAAIYKQKGNKNRRKKKDIPNYLLESPCRSTVVDGVNRHTQTKGNKNRRKKERHTKLLT
jgi:hypothetical protein